MTTEVKTSELLLAYDGDCPMCLATVALLLRLRLVRPEQTRSNHELAGADLEVAQRAGLRNQLVVVDLATRETRAGSDALLWIIGDNTGGHFLVRLLSQPGIRHLLRIGYETISYNRRVISPPRHQVTCDCEPEVTLARRLMLILPLALVTIGLWAAFGAAAFFGWDLGDAAEGAVFGPIAGLSGWLVMTAAGLVVLGGMQRIDYIAHLTVTLFCGTLVLLPAAILALIVPPSASMAIAAVLIVAAFALMFAMQRRRVAAVGLGKVWLWAWAVVLVSTFAGSIGGHFRASEMKRESVDRIEITVFGTQDPPIVIAAELRRIVAELEPLSVPPAGSELGWRLRLFRAGEPAEDIWVSFVGQWGPRGSVRGESASLPDLLQELIKTHRNAAR